MGSRLIAKSVVEVRFFCLQGLDAGTDNVTTTRMVAGRGWFVPYIEILIGVTVTTRDSSRAGQRLSARVLRLRIRSSSLQHPC